MKSLVVYYSRTGTTKKVAEDISKTLKCEIEEIFDTKKRGGPIAWLRAGREAQKKIHTKIKKVNKNLAS